jgi:hypothetical protein
MSKFNHCPTCGCKASGGLFGGVYVVLHYCRGKGHYFCEECKNGDSCPKCGSSDVAWRSDKAFRKE